MSLLRNTLLPGALMLTVAGCASTPGPGFEPTYPEAVSLPPQTNGAIYQEGYALVLFEDRRARRVGDLITIILNEQMSADKDAETTTSKENDVNIESPTLFGYTLPTSDSATFTLDQQLSSSQEFSGRGSSAQSNSLVGTITVTVANVFPNGNLRIRGQKWLTLNQGSELIQISGIIRPEDISPDNTVLSTQVADARVAYKGKGVVADSNRAGWLTRFFLSPFWPY
ncbi:MAG: flagellar basal body L-ring protein FlgH [Gammaproteobacteria bacterium]|nr:flagellar basal body L-ring protein FlgH [Gammaproteobacteria bacterium]